MEVLVDKIQKIVDSCVTPEQLEIAGNFADRARKQIDHEEWFDIATLIQNKADQIHLYDVEDCGLVRRV